MAGSLGFASRLGGRGSVTAEQAAAQMYNSGIVSGFVVSPATPTANMTVTVGGVAGTPDVMVATNAVGNNVFLKNRNTDAFTLSMTAPASNSVIYSIVGFTDDLSVATTDATSISDNPSKCGLIAVAGTSAASPVAPSDAQIRTAITSAGFTGSQAAYGVLGYVTLASTTTTITAPNISQVGRTTLLSADKLDFTTLNFGNYSTTEKDTGFKWHNGKTIYKITNIFDRGTGTTYSHTLPTGVEDVVSVDAIARASTSAGANFIPFPYPGGTAGASASYYRNSATTMRFDVGTDFAATYRYVVASFLYTKA